MKKMASSFLAGVATAGIVGWNVMPDMMLKEANSKYN